MTDFGSSGFEAMGQPVPTFRRLTALKFVLDTCGDRRTFGDCAVLVDSVALHVERDDPHSALKLAGTFLDTTGAYRLLAYLCTGGPR